MKTYKTTPPILALKITSVLYVKTRIKKIQRKENRKRKYKDKENTGFTVIIDETHVTFPAEFCIF